MLSSWCKLRLQLCRGLGLPLPRPRVLVLLFNAGTCLGHSDSNPSRRQPDHVRRRCEQDQCSLTRVACSYSIHEACRRPPAAPESSHSTLGDIHQPIHPPIPPSAIHKSLINWSYSRDWPSRCRRRRASKPPHGPRRRQCCVGVRAMMATQRTMAETYT